MSEFNEEQLEQLIESFVEQVLHADTCCVTDAALLGGNVEFLSTLTAPLVIFLIFVAPIWIIFHYLTKKRKSEGLSAEEHEHLSVLLGQAEKLNQRVESLEAILDNETPNWSKQNATTQP